MNNKKKKGRGRAGKAGRRPATKRGTGETRSVDEGTMPPE